MHIHTHPYLHTHGCVPGHFSHVQLFATLWAVAHQAPLSMGFPRQEYWSGLPLPPLGNLPDPGVEPTSLCVSCIGKVGSLPLAPPGKTPPHTHLPTHIHTYAYTYTHAHISAYMHTHIHTYKSVSQEHLGCYRKSQNLPATRWMSLSWMGKTKELGKPILWLRWHPLAESLGRDSGSGRRRRLTFHRALPISGWEVLSPQCAESLLCTVSMKIPCFR